MRRRTMRAVDVVRGTASSMGSLARELAIVLLAGLVYVVVRELTEGDATAAFANAQSLLGLEQVLGLDWEVGLQALVLQHPVLFDLANWMYVWGHWPVIASSAIFLYAQRREHYRFLRTAVISSGLIGFLFFALVPMAPPRLTGPEYVDTVSMASSYHETFQPPTYTNLFAAMPSLHFGWNLLLGIVLFASSSLLVVRAFAVAMPAAMAFSVVATANHWVLDVLVGLVVVLVGLLVAEAVQRPGVRDAEQPVLRGLEQLVGTLQRGATHLPVRRSRQRSPALPWHR